VSRAVARAVLALAAVLGLSATPTSAAPPPASAATGASATIVRVNIPGRDSVELGAVRWPASPSVEVQSFQYPADGSIVSVGRSRASVSALSGEASTAQASAEAVVLSLLDGAVVAARVSALVSAGASARAAGADLTRSEVQGLRVLGQDVVATPGTTVRLGEWGSLTVLSQSSGERTKAPFAAQGSTVALRVLLGEARQGLPAGTEIVVGSAEATAVAQRARPTRPTQPRPESPPEEPPQRPARPRAPEPESVAAEAVPGGPVQVAPRVSAALSEGGYVFPVYGPVSFGDSFGAPRPNVPGGWHHGEDIFAPLGAPVLAVADGTLHTIGFTKIGGYRLWLRDRNGNEFYYAHLSAYSPLAVEGREVRAGDVIGFVGDTGDAEGGLPHLHFEIHPAAMVGLGYDGVIAPYPILLAWRRAQDVSFSAGRVYVPTAAGASAVPPPGAVLLLADDIGSRSGLVPGALESALSP
jgi:murein DD-endopeptidase MepM/ murein hydrolase activator NlpD